MYTSKLRMKYNISKIDTLKVWYWTTTPLGINIYHFQTYYL
jgi:hypothetical protein